MSEDSKPVTGSSSGDQSLHLLIAGLLVIIAATLAFLWHKERVARVAAQRELQRTQLGQIAQTQALADAMGKLMSINDADLEPVTVQMQGPQLARQVAPSAASRVGLPAGQMVLVLEPQAVTTMPAGNV